MNLKFAGFYRNLILGGLRNFPIRMFIETKYLLELQKMPYFKVFSKWVFFLGFFFRARAFFGDENPG